MLLGCDEETVYRDVIKYVDRPAPPTFVTVTETKECESTDTLKIQIELADIWKNGYFQKDSVLALTTACHALITVKGYTLVPKDTVVRDSIVYQDRVEYVDRPVKVYDTLWQTKVEQRVINQTEYIFPGNSVTYIPTDLQGYVNEFYAKCNELNIPLIGGDVVFSYVPQKDLPGVNWSSTTFEMAGNQQVIQLREDLIWEESRAAVFREMARWQLKKQYVTDISKILCPLFRTSPDPTVSEINILFQ